MPSLEQEIEAALLAQLKLERREAAETPDYSPATRARAYAILAVSKAVKSGAILKSQTFEVLKYYHEHGVLPDAVAAYAVPVPSNTMDPEAKKALFKVTSEIQKLPAKSQIIAANELYRQWPGISRLVSDSSGRNGLAITKLLLAVRGHPIPSRPEYFESLVYGYFYDIDPVSGLLTFLTETIKLCYCESESQSEGGIILRGEGKHPTPNGILTSKLRAERITESALQMSARFPNGAGFTSSFTRAVKGVLLGAWAGGSNDRGRDIFSPMCLSADRFDEASLGAYLGEALNKGNELT